MSPQVPQAESGVVSALGRARAFISQYRTQLLATLAVLATLSVIAAQIVPSFQSWLLGVGVVQYVTLLIVLDIAASQHEGQALIYASALRSKPNQDSALPALIEHAERCKPPSADLLEYACATALPLVRTLCREHIPMRLLVKHPETMSGLQRHRAVATLDTLYNSIFDKYPGMFEIRCYRQPYSLRARRLGNSLLELGWLTPDWERQTAYGHANPSVLVDLKHTDDETLQEFFVRTFEALWTAPDTEDAKAVLDAAQIPDGINTAS